MRIVAYDIEARGLCNQWRIDPESGNVISHPDTIFCIVARDLETHKTYVFGDSGLADFPLFRFKEFLQTVDVLIAHNQINYDLPVLKAVLGIDYEIFYAENKDIPIGCDTVAGKSMRIIDTLLLSKLLNPDRFPGHGLAKFGRLLKDYKGDYVPENGWTDPELKLNQEMLDYCKQDVKLNAKVYHYLLQEAGGSFKWLLPALNLEQAVGDIIQRQEQTGFKFNSELCHKNIEELGGMMEDIEAEVHPQLPKRPLNKGEAKDWTPPVRQVKITEIYLPKTQVKKDGYCSKVIKNMCEKYGGKILSKGVIELFDQVIELPASIETPIHTIIEPSYYMRNFVTKHEGEWIDNLTFKIGDISYIAGQLTEGKSLINETDMLLPDQTAIKEFLLDQGWIPSRWKEKDLTVNSGKQKHSQEKFEETVQRYVDSTLGTSFEWLRCKHLKVSPEELLEKLLSHDLQKPLKVLGQPDYTINEEKEICPNLISLGDQVSYVSQIVKWLTYRHRRNACIGFLKQDRLEVDGRIPTPADTLGAATGRFTHRVVANIPRVTSVYGKPIRMLFGVDEDKLQVGCDADALEARIEGHFCLLAEQLLQQDLGAKAYSDALTAEKPNDTHTLRSEILNISRDEAKKLKYLMTYGGQVGKIQKDFGWSKGKAAEIFGAFWNDAKPLAAFKDLLLQQWEANGKKFLVGPDGRHLVTRSAHSILNVMLQHTGVLCTKRAMVWWDRQIKQLNLDVQQLIAYHDENQMQENKENIEIKVFNTKEDALIEKDRIENQKGIILSDVGEKNDKFFLAYSRAGELAVQSIQFGGQFYNLNVNLTSGYQVGKSWADCH